MNLECQICYEHVVTAGDMVLLKCAHSLCYTCYPKLLNNKCPFCRTVIVRDPDEPQVIQLIGLHRTPNQIVRREYNVFQQGIRVRLRRKRLERCRLTLLERLSDPHHVTVETAGRFRKSRNGSLDKNLERKTSKRTLKNDRKKCRWAKNYDTRSFVNKFETLDIKL